jgi:two-component system chemotaxis response regulator CheY
VIDDMPNMRRTIRNMLRHLGCTKSPIEAEHGQDAWERMQSTTVDFIIADLRMPVMSGTELLRRVRSHETFANIPFLVITAEAEEAMVAEAAETEVDDYIVKPFVAQTLKDRITEILEKKNNPEQADVLLNLGNVYKNSRRYEEAIKEFNKALEITSQKAKVYEAIGETYLLQDELDMAEEMLNKAIDFSPLYVRAYDTLAKVY